MVCRSVWTLCTILLVSSLAAPGHCGPVDAEMLAADKRLQTPVTIAAPHVYVGELLERLSALSGVPLSAEDNKAASGIQVSVFLHKVPIADAMNALWSLLSYQHAEWDWFWFGKPEERRYQLIQTPGAEGLAALLRHQIQDSFEKDAATLLEALNMTDEERKKLAEQNKPLSPLLNSKQTLSGLQIFAETFPPDMQMRVLRGQESPSLSIDQLSDQGRAFVNSMWKGSHATQSVNGGPPRTTPEPTSIQFTTFHIGDPPDLYPTLFLSIEGLGGMNYVGNEKMEKVTQDNLAAQWMLPGDTAASPEESASIPKPATATPPVPDEDSLDHRLQQLADGTPLSLMALSSEPAKGHSLLPGVHIMLPGPLNGESISPSEPYARTVKQYLARLREHHPALIQHKWRNNILLLTHPSLILNDQGNVPYAVVKHLRTAEHNGGGMLTLRDLAETAERLTQSQLRHLGEEFQVMRTVALMRNLFVIYRRFPEMGSDVGLRLNAEIIATLSAPPEAPVVRDIQEARGRRPVNPVTTLFQQGATAIRLVQTPYSDGQDRLTPLHRTRYEFQCLSDEGTILARTGFVYGRSVQ